MNTENTIEGSGLVNENACVNTEALKQKATAAKQALVARSVAIGNYVYRIIYRTVIVVGVVGLLAVILFGFSAVQYNDVAGDIRAAYKQPLSKTEFYALQKRARSYDLKDVELGKNAPEKMKMIKEFASCSWSWYYTKTAWTRMTK
jgi:hypothetical protein